MGTRSVIARPTPEGGFHGTYCHYDGYPAHQGRVLFDAVTGHFGGDTDAACTYLIDQHPAGWSVLHGDFTTPPGYRLAKSLRPSSGATSPSARPPVSGGMPQASQWMNRPPGASGSSRISPRERLPVGGAVHDSGGERSSPSQVWRRGIAPPTAKALLVSRNSTTATLSLSPPSFAAARPPRRPPQQVTWSRPITAPSAWFQTGITSGVGSSSTWQRFRAK